MGGDQNVKLQPGWDRIDPATGAPEGIGKNWDYAPGASVANTISAMAAKIRQWSHRIGKGFMDSLPAARADALAQAYRRLPTTADDVRRYAQRGFENSQGGDEDRAPLPPSQTLGRLTLWHSARVKAVTGKDIDGFDFSIDPSGVRHVVRHHADDAAERRRGQRGVTAADFAKLPAILDRPDLIRAPTSTETGGAENLVEFVKTIEGERFVATMEVLRGRRSLALKTLRIHVGGEDRDSSTRPRA